MNILNICDSDMAGVGIRLTEAVNRCTDHTARHIRMVPHKFEYPKDIQTRDPAVVEKWVRWADVVITHVTCRPLRLGKRKLRPECLLIMYHGRHYRSHRHEVPDIVRRWGIKATLCTSPTMTAWGLTWVPWPIPVNEYARLRRGHEGKPIVCQTPSAPDRLNTAPLKEILGHRDDIDLRIATGMPHTECLRYKAVADVFLDRFRRKGGPHFHRPPIAVSGIEAMAMGIPVIANTGSEEEIAFRQATDGLPLPYYASTIRKVSEAIDALLGDAELYQEYVRRGLRHVRGFHDYPAAAKRFVGICEEALTK